MGQFQLAETSQRWVTFKLPLTQTAELTQDAAVRHCQGQGNQRRKLTPFLPPEEQSASKIDPIPRSGDKNNLLVLPRRLPFQSEHDSRPSSAMAEADDADEHPVE